MPKNEKPTDLGHYVHFENNYNGPYPTKEDAQAFNSGHLGGKGKIIEIE